MPFVPAPSIARVAINYISETLETATNVLHFRNLADGVNTTSVNALLVYLKAWQTAEWAPVASADWQTDLYEVRDMSVQDGMVWTDIETISGLVNSPGLPAQNTIAISLRSGLAGRSRRGRTYHVGLAEDQVIGSRTTVGHATALAEAYSALITGTGEDWAWGIASYVSNGAPRTEAMFTTITSCILTDTIVDSMDTRKPRA